MISKLNSNGNDEQPRSRFNLTCDLNEPLQRVHWIHENETNVLEIEYNEHRPRSCGINHSTYKSLIAVKIINGQ